MASLKHLSDEELRKKLKEFGISSPVTASTRNVLLKKLNHLLSSDKSEQNRSRRISSRNINRVDYSGNSRNDIIGLNRNVNESPQESITPPKFSLSINSKSSSLKLRNNNRHIPTSLSSFSSDEEDTDYPVQETHSGRSSKKPVFDESPQDSPNTPSSFFSNPLSLKKKIPVIRKRTSFSPLYNDLKSPKSNHSDEYDYESESDSDLGTISYSRLHSNDKSVLSKDRYHGNNISHKPLADNHYDTFYRERDSGEITSPDDIISQEPINSHLHLANGQGPLERVRKLAAEHCSLDKDFWLPSVPLVLVILLTLFFCFLGLCYVSIHTPLHPSKLFSFLNVFHYGSKGAEHYENEVIPKGGDNINKFPVCEDEVKMDCLSKLEMENVSEILGLLEKVILPTLRERSQLYQCKKMSHNYLTTEEMIELINEVLLHKTDENNKLGVIGLGKLVNLNPHWGVKATWEREPESSKLIGFETASSPIEILCLITSALYYLFSCVLICLLGISCIWIAFKAHSYFARQAEEIEQKSFEMVEQILEMLENSCGTDGKDYIAVNHIRDCLIPPRERLVKEKIWNKAVNFIDEHDSRVYREIRTVGGEDCEVWRWVSGAPRSPVLCSKNLVDGDCNNQPPEKVWQGQAFESLETTQNVPQVSPTSCLKVRNMFDCEIEFGENWPSRIQDSLLEKCEGIAITHIAVDRVSKEGCVYVKCASAAEAGKAYRALHGWWFDGNLVTVKYLREERYFERFPTARISSTSLTPSNNKRLSLSLQNYHPLTTTTTTTPHLRKMGEKNISRFGKS